MASISGLYSAAEDRSEVSLGVTAAQVGPGAEATAGAGDHDGARRIVAGGGFERSEQLPLVARRSARSALRAG